MEFGQGPVTVGEVQGVLRKVRSLLERPSSWAQGSRARTKKGSGTFQLGAAAEKWDLLGALDKIIFGKDPAATKKEEPKDQASGAEDRVFDRQIRVRGTALLLLSRHGGGPTTSEGDAASWVIEFNDDPATSHRDVLDLLDDVCEENGES